MFFIYFRSLDCELNTSHTLTLQKSTKRSILSNRRSKASTHMRTGAVTLSRPLSQSTLLTTPPLEPYWGRSRSKDTWKEPIIRSHSSVHTHLICWVLKSKPKYAGCNFADILCGLLIVPTPYLSPVNEINHSLYAVRHRLFAQKNTHPLI